MLRTVADRHWIEGKNDELNLPVYFKNVLTSQEKPVYVLHWDRGFPFFSTVEEKVWKPSNLMKIIFVQKIPHG